MRKQFIINVAYRLRSCKTAPVQEMQLVAHSIQDAKSAFMLWQQEQQGWNNSKPPLYTFIAGTKLKEVVDTAEKKEWLRLNPSRVKSQVYVCPHCQKTCYSHSHGCDYRFCPRCGRRVL